jgi:hypothetical protein
VQIQTSGSVSILCKEEGSFTFVVVAFDEDGKVQGVAYDTFNFPPINVSIEDDYGNYILTGTRVFGAPPAEMAVTIKAGKDENTLIITGIDLAESVEATFDPLKGTMSIAPQLLANLIDDDGEYELEFLTFNGNFSETAVMTFSLKPDGTIVLTSSSEAYGYLIWGENVDDEDDAGWFDGYYDLVFTPDASLSKARMKKSASSLSRNKIVSKTRDLGKISIVRKVEDTSKKENVTRLKASRKSFKENFKATPIR